MKPIKFEGMTHILGRPDNWDEDKNGPCVDLPVMVQENEEGRRILSIWQPSEEERKLLIEGSGVVISFLNEQPTFSVGVSLQSCEDIQPTEITQESTTSHPQPSAE